MWHQINFSLSTGLLAGMAITFVSDDPFIDVSLRIANNSVVGSLRSKSEETFLEASDDVLKCIFIKYRNPSEHNEAWYWNCFDSWQKKKIICCMRRIKEYDLHEFG
jgi:hypothetical protein